MTYHFQDLIDVERLQRMADELYSAAGIPVGIIGVDNQIHIAAGWQDICTKFHRLHPVTCERCHQSDDYIKNHLHEGDFVAYKCQNNLWDIAIPIVIDGQHLATLFV